MHLRRRALLLDPPAMAAPDIAFILIVFFLVCASVQPDTGRRQSVPRTEETADDAEPSRTIDVSITRGAVVIDGELVAPDAVAARMRDLLRGTDRPEDRITVVKSSPDTPYDRWIAVTTDLERAGAVLTLQLTEERTVTVD